MSSIISALGLARGQRWHRGMGHSETHARPSTQAPSGWLRGNGRIGRQVAVQRPRALRSSRSWKSSATDTEGDLLAYNLLLNTKSFTGPFPFYLMQVEIIYSLYKKHTLCLTPLLSARRGDIKGAGVYIECKALKLGMSHKCSHVCAPKEWNLQN